MWFCHGFRGMLLSEPPLINVPNSHINSHSIFSIIFIIKQQSPNDTDISVRDMKGLHLSNHYHHIGADLGPVSRGVGGAGCAKSRGEDA